MLEFRLRGVKRGGRREPLPSGVKRELVARPDAAKAGESSESRQARDRRAAPRHRFIGRVLGGGLRALGRTLRLEVRGAQHIAQAELAAQAGQGGALFAVWHGRLIVPALATRDRDYLVLVSRSGDGEIAAAAMRALGWRVARGSAFRGATGGTRCLLRALKRGAIVALTPDGPRGPNRVALSGAVHLARRAGCQLHPVGAACRGWTLPTWDALLIPRPFARAAMVVGAPLSLESDAQDEQTQRLQNAMLECEAEAERLLQSAQTRARDERTFRVWNALLLPLYPILGAYTLWRRRVQGRSQASLRGQWGHVPRHVVRALHPPKDKTSAPIIWLHAVSVGETLAARPVVRALREAMPDCRIGLSVTTDSGFETAQGALKAREVEAVFYFPLDLPFVLRRVLKRIRPDVFLTMETELWPNLLHLARKQGAKTWLVNGRVSDNLLKTAPQLGPLWRWMMSNLDGCLMRSEFDAARLKLIGAAPERVQAVGDVKLDSTPQNAPESRAKWRRELGIESDALFWVAGSTHLGEEEMVVRAWAELKAEFPDLRLLIAPRHIERAQEIGALIEQLGQRVARRTQLSEDESVLLLDTVGELAQIYGAADVAFVGGSLIPRGGHNVLEPVLAGVPTIFGPHVANFREAARLAWEADLGKQVQNEAELTDAVRFYLRDKAEREAIAPRARQALQPHAGAARRIARIIAQALNAHNDSSTLIS